MERGRGLHMHVCDDLSKWVDYLGDPADLSDPMIAAEAGGFEGDRGSDGSRVLRVLADGDGLRAEGKAKEHSVQAHHGDSSHHHPSPPLVHRLRV